MKKIFAILLSATLLLSLFVGCGKKAENTPTSTDDTVATPVAVGMLVLNAGAAVNISYDSDGLVLHVEGADDDGTTLAGAYTGYLGKPVAEAVCDLIGQSAVNDFLSTETGFVMMKVAHGSTIPGSTFLETLRSEAQSAVKQYSPAKVFLLTKADLDSDGYINLDAAKELLLAYLVLETFDTLDGTVKPVEGLYSFAVTTENMNARFIVDAVTGSVYQGELAQVDYGDVYLGDESDFAGATEEPIPTEDLTVPATPEDPTNDNVNE